MTWGEGDAVKNSWSLYRDNIFLQKAQNASCLATAYAALTIHSLFHYNIGLRAVFQNQRGVRKAKGLAYLFVYAALEDLVESPQS